jgi:hypothetical protein
MEQKSRLLFFVSEKKPGFSRKPGFFSLEKLEHGDD